MNETLYIKDKITNNKNITNDGYVVYLALLCLIRKDQKIYYINPTLLAYELTGVYPPNRQIINSMITGISNLTNEKLIHNNMNIPDKNKKLYEWIIDISDIYERSGYFVNIDISDIRKIFEKKERYRNAISLLRFYIYLLTTLHKKKDELEGVGFTSIDTMAEETDLNQKTIYSYINELESFGLIFVYRSKCSILNKDGGIKEISSTYGKLINKDKIIKIGMDYEKSYNTQKISRKNKNKLRSLSQKYNYLVSCIENGKKIPYSDNILNDMYLSLIELNNSYIKHSRSDRVKDLSIFSNYDFYERDVNNSADAKE